MLWFYTFEKLTLEKVRQLPKHDVFLVQCIITYKTDICQWKKMLARKLRTNNDVYYNRQ